MCRQLEVVPGGQADPVGIGRGVVIVGAVGMFQFDAHQQAVKPAFGPPDQIDQGSITFLEGQVVLKVLQVDICIPASDPGGDRGAFAAVSLPVEGFLRFILIERVVALR